MKKMMWLLLGILFLSTRPVIAEIVTFDDLTLDPNTYYNGSDIIGGGEGEFETTGVTFNIFYDGTYVPYWEGFAYSNTTDTTTPGYTNQYSAIAGMGADASSNYGVGYVDGFYGSIPTITFADEVNLAEAYITNTTYAFLAMQDGEEPAKKYGGDTGNDPDYYKLTITGKDADEVVTDVVEFYLADFRSADNSQDYIVDDWTAVDLSGLGLVKTVEFSVSSSDMGDWGINTPTYFAIDNIAFSFTDIDDDGDGYTEDQGDCDDFNAGVNPGVTEVTYNGVDDDCDEETPDDDLDGDGYLLEDDCDETDASIYPGATEICEDGVDQDCDGQDSECSDGDGLFGCFIVTTGEGFVF